MSIYNIITSIDEYTVVAEYYAGNRTARHKQYEYYRDKLLTF